MILDMINKDWSNPVFNGPRSGLSRICDGLHYPMHVSGGAVGLSLYKLKTPFLKTLILIMFLFPSLVWSDPTHGKPFFPWVWEDQLKPTIKKSYDRTGVTIFASALASTFIIHQYDGKTFDFSEDGGNLWMSKKMAGDLGKIGNGLAGVALVTTQYFIDENNGIKSAMALILTSASHIAITATVRRHRPRNRSDFLPWPSSFPSGHTSSAFALAGSMAYSYGLRGAIPGYLLAGAIGVSRIKENRHWISDVIGGAFLGSFWARASFRAHELEKSAYMIIPTPIDDGMEVSVNWSL